MALINAIRATPIPASNASANLLSPIDQCYRPCNQSGRGREPNTLSMTIFSGHGDARLIAVSISIATNTMASHPVYGRTRACTSESISLEVMSRGASSLSVAAFFSALANVGPGIGSIVEFVDNEQILLNARWPKT